MKETRIIVSEADWNQVWEYYHAALKEHLSTNLTLHPAPKFAIEQAERIMRRCQGRLDGTYHGGY